MLPEDRRNAESASTSASTALLRKDLPAAFGEILGTLACMNALQPAWRHSRARQFARSMRIFVGQFLHHRSRGYGQRKVVEDRLPQVQREAFVRFYWQSVPVHTVSLGHLRITQSSVAAAAGEPTEPRENQYGGRRQLQRRCDFRHDTPNTNPTHATTFSARNRSHRSSSARTQSSSCGGRWRTVESRGNQYSGQRQLQRLVRLHDAQHARLSRHNHLQRRSVASISKRPNAKFPVAAAAGEPLNRAKPVWRPASTATACSGTIPQAQADPRQHLSPQQTGHIDLQVPRTQKFSCGGRCGEPLNRQNQYGGQRRLQRLVRHDAQHARLSRHNHL